MLNILSLGAGVQSSTMALMATAGELTPMPDCAIFADTHHEPAAVYAWLDALEKLLPFPVYRVSAGDLWEATMRRRVSKKNGKPYWKAFVPTYSVNADGSSGMFPRKCTTDFKIIPIQRKVRELAKPKRGKKDILVHQWIGISRDEAHRMKPARKPYILNIFPLVDMNITRKDCLRWMADHGYPAPPKSACVFCPYHSDATWKNLKETDPVGFERAVEFERQLNTNLVNQSKTAQGEFLHASRVPLAEVDFDPNRNQMDLWGNECEGMCGN